MTGSAAIIDLSVGQLGLAVLLVGVVIVISAESRSDRCIRSAIVLLTELARTLAGASEEAPD